MNVSEKIKGRIEHLKKRISILSEENEEYSDGKITAMEGEIDFLLTILIKIVMDEDRATEASFREEMIRDDAERSAKEKW